MASLDETVVQKKKAYRIIRFRTLLTAGAGFIPFPLLDAAGILSIQLWMIRDLARLYEVPFKKHIAKSLVGALVGSLGPVIGAVKLVPGPGTLIGGGVLAASAAATTYALGRIFAHHFSQGETLLNFDPVKSKEFFQHLYEEGKASVEELNEQDASFKETHSRVVASVNDLKRTNDELRATITTLQNQLAQSKKDRKYALAALKEKKHRRRFRWLGALLLIVLLFVTVFWLFRVGYFNSIKDKLFGEHGLQNIGLNLLSDVSDPESTPNPSQEANLSVDSVAGKEQDPIPASQTQADTMAVPKAGPTAADLNFTTGTTEALMADYLSVIDTVFPKTFPLTEIQFEEGGTELKEEGLEQLIRIANLLQNYPRAKIRVSGQADQNGGMAINRQAGKKRARLIQEALEQHGVPGSWISTTYLEKPVKPDAMLGAEIEIIRRQ